MSAAEETTLSAVWGDMLFLSIFAAVTLGIAIPLFKRTCRSFLRVGHRLCHPEQSEGSLIFVP